MHAFFLLPYFVLASVLELSSSGGSDLAGQAALWLLFCGACVWLVVLVNLIRWSRSGEGGLVRRAVAWDALLWLGPFLVLPLHWGRTRRLLVPSSANNDLGSALIVHGLFFLPVYFALASVLLGPAWPVSLWLTFAGGWVWLTVLRNLVRWSLQGRTGLFRRAVIWDALLWLGPVLLLLLRRERTRRLLVPDEPEIELRDEPETPPGTAPDFKTDYTTDYTTGWH